jgi:hypothetical protein
MRSICPSLYVRRRTPFLVVLAVLASGSVSCSSDSPVTPESSAQSGVIAHATINDPNAIIVTNAAELVAALVPGNAGRSILMRSGTYNVTQPLFVPDGATLTGEGEMLLDGAGLPTGFALGTRTTIAMTANVSGDVLTLGNGASVRDVAVDDLPGRVGSVIAVDSRSAADSVSATITEVEITNPNAHLIVLTGPSGCGVTVLTQNPHTGAVVSATMTRSLIHSPSTGTGCGVFAFNFAPLASISVDLRNNVIGGGMIANGGVSRAVPAHDSKTVVQSRGNLYRDDSPSACVSNHLAWNLAGGSGIPAPVPIGETARNTLRVHSQDDRIDGFARGIIASAGRRFFALPIAGPVTDNTLDLELIGTTISTLSCGGASFVSDFRLAGALVTNASVAPGNGNVLRAVFRGVTGGGTRSNTYADVLGPTGPLPSSLQGTGNLLQFAGNQQSFAQTNANIDPAPPATSFTGGR